MVKKNLCLISMFCLILGCSDHSIKSSGNEKDTDKNNKSQTDGTSTSLKVEAKDALYTQLGKPNCSYIAVANAIAAFDGKTKDTEYLVTVDRDEIFRHNPTSDLLLTYSIVNSTETHKAEKLDLSTQDLFDKIHAGYNSGDIKYMIAYREETSYRLAGDYEGDHTSYSEDDYVKTTKHFTFYNNKNEKKEHNTEEDGHVVYVEGFATINGQLMMQFDYYGSNGYLTKELFNSQLNNTITDIYAVTRR